MKVNLPASRRAKSLSPPNMTSQVYTEFTKGVRSGQWAYGPSCLTLEKAIAQELDLDPACVIATASCSHALAAARHFMHLNKPRVCPLTWPATYGYEGTWVDFENYCRSLPAVDIAVDLWGEPAWTAKPPIILDAAHRFLAPEHAEIIHGKTNFITYSFAPQKEISALMGGALVMRKPEWRDGLLTYLNGGIYNRYAAGPGVPKGLMPSPIARMVRAKMHEHPVRYAARQLALQKYHELLDDRLLTTPGYASGHLAVVLARTGAEREEWRGNLDKHGFQHGWHYPMTQAQKEAAPIASDLSDRVLTLPLHCHLTAQDAVEVLRRMVGA